jgi:hypothetical protein
MVNPDMSVIHARWQFVLNSDRSTKASFGATFGFYDTDGGLTGAEPSDITQLYNACLDYIQEVQGDASHALGFYLSSSLSRGDNEAEITFTDVSNALAKGEAAGSPFAIYQYTLIAAQEAQALPEAVCQVVSWRAAYGTDPEYGTHTRPRADDRNRQYFGPLTVGAITSDAESPSRVEFSTYILSDINAAFTQCFSPTTNETSGSTQNIVAWSRKEAAVKIAVDFSQQLYPCIQRRREDSRPLLDWTPIS